MMKLICCLLAVFCFMSIVYAQQVGGTFQGGGGMHASGNVGGNPQTATNDVRNFLSSTGTVMYDVDQNALLVTDYPENINRVGEFLKEVDIPSHQVLIEARIVEVKLEGEHSLGVNWRLFSEKTGYLKAGKFQFFSDIDNKTSGISTVGTALSPVLPFKSTNYPPNSTTGTENPFSLTIMNENIYAVMKALSNQLKTTVLSAPSITTVNNRKADIRVITQLRWVTPNVSVSDAGAVTLSWNEGTGSPQDVGIILEVTPRITDDGQVSLELNPEISEHTEDISLEAGPDGNKVSYVIPIIEKRSASTKVIVGDSQTIILGGLIKNKRLSGESKIPFLGDIPGVGYFFKSKKDTREKTELLIFVSPKIIRSEEIKDMKLLKTKATKAAIGPSILKIEKTLGPDVIEEGRYKRKQAQAVEEPVEDEAVNEEEATSAKKPAPMKVEKQSVVKEAPSPAVIPAAFNSQPAVMPQEAEPVSIASPEDKQKAMKRLLDLFDKE